MSSNKTKRAKGGNLLDFIHIADVHLGATPEAGKQWGKDREKELFDTFFGIIKLCEEKKTDLLLIAGDLFHRQPLLRELKEVSYMLGKLSHTKVVLIAGNHDYIGPRSNYIDFKWSDNVTMLTTADMDSVYFEELNTEVYGLSYRTRDVYEAKYDKVIPGVEERINILLGHGGEETKIPIDVTAIQKQGFDYIAMGHFHKKRLISQSMNYPGSLEPLDKNETEKHGYIEGSITKNEDNTSQVTSVFVPFACREYIPVTITVTPETTNTTMRDELKEQIKTHGEKNFFEVTIEGYRDPDILLDSKELYEEGNVVEVVDHVLPDYDFEHLLEENKDNLIGAYIKKIQSESQNEEILQKALYYGIEALLNTKER